jgi:hypothetical protein
LGGEQVYLLRYIEVCRLALRPSPAGLFNYLSLTRIFAPRLKFETASQPGRGSWQCSLYGMARQRTATMAALSGPSAPSALKPARYRSRGAPRRSLVLWPLRSFGTPTSHIRFFISRYTYSRRRRHAKYVLETDLLP